MKFTLQSLSALSLLALTVGVGCGQASTSSSSSNEHTGSTSEAVSTGLVISSVYGGGGGTGATYKTDYVELFNRGTVALPTTGMAIQYAVANNIRTGAANPWNVLPLPTATIAPGHYYLVRVFTAGANGVDLPTVDYDATTADAGTLANYGTASGIVALTSTTTPITCGTDGGTCGAEIVDMLSYGSTCPAVPTTGDACGNTVVRPTVYEGSNAAGAPTNVQGTFRKDGGCTDTDDNASDIDVTSFSATVAPRNSSSPAHVCSLDAGVVDAAIDVAVDTGVVPTDTGTPPADTGTPPADTGTPADAGTDAKTDSGTDAKADTGTTPSDTGVEEDTGSEPADTGTEPADTGTAQADTGTDQDSGVAAEDVVEDDGCGCRVAGSSHESSMAGGLAALALAGVLARRRRR